MPRALLICEPLGRTVEAGPDDTVFSALRRAGVPVGSACDGEGICGRCGLSVRAGELSPPDEAELRVLRANRLRPGVRLSCRARPSGEVVLSAPYWGKARGGGAG